MLTPVQSGTLLVLSAVAAVAVVLGRAWVLRRHARRAAEAARLEASGSAASEDTTRFAEELQLVDQIINEETTPDNVFKDLLKAHECLATAQTAMDGNRVPEAIRKATAALGEGRYAMSRVQAWLAGRPAPRASAPCFFNPAHGPSTATVRWTDAHGNEFAVPACAADATRITAGARPNIRMVPLGDDLVPYWEAGQDYRPWALGYFEQWRTVATPVDRMLTTVTAA
ncbi:MAG: hypothetical protein WAV45_01975 [Propionibacteriaceae bacterium]